MHELIVEAPKVQMETQEPEREEANEDEMAKPIDFTTEELTKLYQPWKQTLIIQTVGYTKSIVNIEKHLQGLGEIKGALKRVELGKGCYIIKTENGEDYTIAIAGGPWLLFNYYLAIQQWKPDFEPSTDGFKNMAIWVQLPELPIEYYETQALLKIGKGIGKPIKIDWHTSQAKTGKYARMCIEIDTSKPLTKSLKIGRRKQRITYEISSEFCYKCGKVGHLDAVCQKTPTEA